uniref:RNA polymerase beta'' subunit n=1 Tax=Polulichloris maxima TaxID=2704661 RepID=UPI00241175A3|nr:RNA polymerase beta'' subunit [Polulichloris maxima]WDY13271.1 RNA polymerase beta'' subunit [Polulichloris maxima]
MIASEKENSIFFNHSFDKKRLKALISWVFKKYGELEALKVLDILKSTGFQYATKAGISIGLHDLTTPTTKSWLISESQQSMNTTYRDFISAKITATERSQRIIDTWHRASESLSKQVVDYFGIYDTFNPVYIMALSGARGNFSQVRQLIGMRGLMADQQGKIVNFPIRSNLREGLTITEYFISCSGARKGLVDTALRTADTGYLTRRLVDVSHHVVVKRIRCNTDRGIAFKDLQSYNKILLSLKERLVGRVLAENILLTDKLLAKKDKEINTQLALDITRHRNQVFIRSPLTCGFTHEVCQLCYGWSISQGSLVSLGDAVGVIAAQSIGEPGTQLTMRTFHTGGVFSGDLLQEIRAPYAGKIEFSKAFQGLLIRTGHGRIAFFSKTSGFLILRKDSKESPHSIPIQPFTMLFVRQGEKVEKNQLLGEASIQKKEGNQPIKTEQILFAELSGRIIEDCSGKTYLKYLKESSLLVDILRNYMSRKSMLCKKEPRKPIEINVDAKENICKTQLLTSYKVEDLESDLFRYIEPVKSGRLGFLKILATRIGSTFNYTSPIKFKNEVFQSFYQDFDSQYLRNASKVWLKQNLKHTSPECTENAKQSILGMSTSSFALAKRFAKAKPTLLPLSRICFFEAKQTSYGSPVSINSAKKYLHPEYIKENRFFLQTIAEYGDIIKKKIKIVTTPMFFNTTINHSGCIVARPWPICFLSFSKKKPSFANAEFSKPLKKASFIPEMKTFTSGIPRWNASLSLVYVPAGTKKAISLYLPVHRRVQKKASFALAKESGYASNNSNLQSKTSIENLLRKTSCLKIPLSGEILKENFSDIFYTHLEIIAFSVNSVSLNIKIGDYLSSGDKIGFVNRYAVYRTKQQSITNNPTVLPLCNKQIFTKTSNKSKNFSSTFFFKKSFAEAKLPLQSSVHRQVQRRQVQRKRSVPRLHRSNVPLKCTFGGMHRKCKAKHSKHVCAGFCFNKTSSENLLLRSKTKLAPEGKTFTSGTKLDFSQEKLKKTKLMMHRKFCTIGMHLRNAPSRCTFVARFYTDKCKKGYFFAPIDAETNVKQKKDTRVFQLRCHSREFGSKKQKKNTRVFLLRRHYREFASQNKEKKIYKSRICLHLTPVKQDNTNKPFYKKPIILPSSGRVLTISKTQLILQKTQQLLFYDSATLHVKKGEWVKEGAPILTLTHQTLITGDIVQGIPRIEQLFEAFTSPPPGLREKKGGAKSKFKNVHDTLHSQVRDIFRKNWLKNVLPIAVRKSLEEIQYIIVEMIQKVYLSQGVLIADKHIEIIIRQMTSKGQVLDSGSTGLLLEEVLPIRQIENANITTPGKKCLYVPAVVGLTAAALTCDSFISAASFQETTRVLSRDAVVGKSDFLRGLKEKVVIGDLISAGTGLDIYFIYTLFLNT